MRAFIGLCLAIALIALGALVLDEGGRLDAFIAFVVSLAAAASAFLESKRRAPPARTSPRVAYVIAAVLIALLALAAWQGGTPRTPRLPDSGIPTGIDRT